MRQFLGLGACAAETFAAKSRRREDRFSPGRRPIAPLWGKNRREYGTHPAALQSGRLLSRRLLGRRWCLLVVPLLLAACGDGGQVPDRTGAAVAEAVGAEPATHYRAPADQAGFHVSELEGHVRHGRPAVRLRFSQALVASQDFDQLIDLTDTDGGRPNGSWMLAEDNQALVFPWLAADTRYQLTVTAQLTAADGTTLGQPFAHAVYSGPQLPMLGFASQGNILPADSAGLPVITINVTEADVEFLRVRDADLARFLADYQRNGQRGSWQLQELAGMADIVHSGRFALRADANERTLNHIPVRDIGPLRAPGAYFAVMRAAGQFEDSYATALFFVSDIGLHARLHQQDSFVHAASLASGKPIAGIELELLDQHGRPLAQARTDRDGNATLPLRPQREHLLVARQQGDFSLLSFRQPALDLSAFDIAGRPHSGERDAFLWAGRDLFRPGETVAIHGLLRDFDGRAVAPSPLFLSLKQPDGRIHSRHRAEADALGHFSFQRELAGNVATGRWKLEAALEPDGPAIGEFPLRIEEFLPERLKLDLDSPAETLVPGQPVPLSVQAAYLYGAPAAGNRFLAELSFEHPTELVQAQPGFHFGDPGLALPRPGEPALDTRLDAQGQVQTRLALPDDLPAQTPVAVFVRGSVFESGGRAVSRTIKQVSWPAKHLVGIRPQFDAGEGAPADSTVGFELIRADADGALAAGTVQVRLLRDRQDVIWSHDPELGWRVEYQPNWEPVGTAQTLTLDAAGAVRYLADVQWGSYRLEASDEQTGLVTRLPFHAGWRGADSAPGDAPRPDRVAITLDKAAYQAGDTALLTLTPPHPGPGLLLVEAGERLLASRSIQVDTGTRVELAIEPDWERHDIHVTAIVFRPGSAARKITPNRALGIVHLPIDRSQRQVAVSLDAAAQARPGDELVITVQAPQLAGQQAMATVSAVDLGIINITRYPVPDAGGHFFAARAHQVDAHDVYGRVVEHHDGYSARLRFGGDLALASLPQARRPTARVATVDLFSGPVQLDAQGQATVRLTLPDFNGQLRLAALVWTGERYGHGSGTVQVRAPLVAEVSSPRVMAPGDRSQLSLDLHNLSGKAQTLELHVQAQPPLAVGQDEHRLTLDDNQRQVLQIPLQALPGHGTGRLSVQVRGDGIDLDREFELVVRPGWAASRASRLQEESAPTTITLEPALLADYLPGSGILATGVSRQAPIPFASAVDGLISYPYGCLEQITSRAFPLALLDDATARRLGLDIATLDSGRRQQALESVFSQLSGMQLASGHFSFWPGEHGAQTQLTPFVAELLIEARDAGQMIPEPVLAKALTRLNEDLLAGGDRYYAYDNSEALRFAVRAHAGYVLARLGRAPLGTLRALHEHERGHARSLLSLVHLGLALHLQGDTRRGLETLNQAFAEPPQRPQWLGDYGSELRDRALALALLRQHQVTVPASSDALLGVARELAGRQDRRPLSTQEQLALFRLGRQLDGADDLPLAGRVIVGGETVPIPPVNLFSRSFDEADLAAGARIAVAGEGPLYVLRESVGLPRSAPEPMESGLSIRRDWFTANGEPFRGNRLHEGDSLIVRLTVQAQQQSDDLLVVDYLPGGLEAENLNLADHRLLAGLTVEGVDLEQRHGTDIRHEEYRDDRYVAALRLWPGQTGELWYIARAVSPGQFAVPAPQVGDMYRPQLRAIGNPDVPRLTVSPPQ